MATGGAPREPRGKNGDNRGYGPGPFFLRGAMGRPQPADGDNHRSFDPLDLRQEDTAWRGPGPGAVPRENGAQGRAGAFRRGARGLGWPRTNCGQGHYAIGPLLFAPGAFLYQ